MSVLRKFLAGALAADAPFRPLAGARSVLVLFGATNHGESDLRPLRDLGVRDVTVVDHRRPRMAEVQASFPAEWEYVLSPAADFCREAVDAERRFDAVVCDGSSGSVAFVWEDLFPLLFQVGREKLLVRVTQEFLDLHGVVAGAKALSDFVRRRHGIVLDPPALTRRSSSRGGTYWAAFSLRNAARDAVAGAPARSLKFDDIPYGKQYCVELRDFFGENGCIAHASCRQKINEYRQTLTIKEEQAIYKAYTSARFAAEPKARIDSLGLCAASFDLDRFSSMEDVWEAARVATGKRGRVNREVNKAVKLGFRVKPFAHAMFVPDLHAIHHSSETRGGKPMRDDYRQSIDDMGGAPKAWIDPPVPACPVHKREYWGVFRPAPGHRQGDVVTDEQLVGYIHLEYYGSNCRYSRIMGHDQHLQSGVMYLLHFSLVEHLLVGRPQGLRYIFYGAMRSGPKDGSLTRWKERALFEPKYLIYDEPGDWGGAAGMRFI